MRAAVRLRRILPETSIAVVAACASRRDVLDLVGDGSASVGLLLRQQIADASTLCADLRRIASGETLLHPHSTVPIPTRSVERPVLERLTERQHEVLSAMATGSSNSAIARQLGISEKAVVQHASHIYDQLGLEATHDIHRRVRAVLRYLEDAQFIEDGR
jgi:DNA-binding NarL/FixJ family response regulator